jgi:3-oxoacyl-[acyl-carrier protein] reductase
LRIITPVVVAITGASAGIGRATAELLAEDSASLSLFARRADRLEVVAKHVRARGGQALVVPGDVTSPGDLETLVRRATEAFGRLDVMICNAGVGFHGAIADTPPEVAERLVRVNLLGTIHAARAATVQFQRQQAGHVIAISSAAGLHGIAGMSVYSATKAAQIGFIEALRTEFLGTSIHASVVCPVSTATEFHEAMRRDYGHAVDGLGPRQDVDTVARAIVRCIREPRAEVYPHGKARLIGLAKAVAPAWTDRRMKKYGRRIDGGGDG